MINKEKAAKALVRLMWDDVSGRSGMDLGCLEKFVQREIKQEWTEMFMKFLTKLEKNIENETQTTGRITNDI